MYLLIKKQFKDIIKKNFKVKFLEEFKSDYSFSNTSNKDRKNAILISIEDEDYMPLILNFGNVLLEDEDNFKGIDFWVSLSGHSFLSYHIYEFLFAKAKKYNMLPYFAKEDIPNTIREKILNDEVNIETKRALALSKNLNEKICIKMIRFKDEEISSLIARRDDLSPKALKEINKIDSPFIKGILIKKEIEKNKPISRKMLREIKKSPWINKYVYGCMSSSKENQNYTQMRNEWIKYLKYKKIYST